MRIEYDGTEEGLKNICNSYSNFILVKVENIVDGNYVTLEEVSNDET